MKPPHDRFERLALEISQKVNLRGDALSPRELADLAFQRTATDELEANEGLRDILKEGLQILLKAPDEKWDVIKKKLIDLTLKYF